MKKIKFIIPAAALATCIPAGATLVGIAAQNAAESKAVNAITVNWDVIGDGELTGDPEPIEGPTTWENLNASQLKVPVADTTTNPRAYFSGWTINNTPDEHGQYTPITDDTPITDNMTIYAVFGEMWAPAFEHSVETLSGGQTAAAKIDWSAEETETLPTVEWKSDDEDTFTISGKTSTGCTIVAATGVEETQTAHLTATYYTGVEKKTISCKVIVQPEEIPVTSIRLSYYRINDIQEGSTARFPLPAATLLPEDATDKTVTWTVSDTSKFSIVEDSGVTYVEGKGAATTTGICFAHAATTNAEVFADVQLDIVPKNPEAFTLAFSTETPPQITAKKDPIEFADYLEWPSDISDHRVIWTTDDSRFPDSRHISLDANGRCECSSGKTDGKITITATSAYNRAISATWQLEALGNNYNLIINEPKQKDYFVEVPKDGDSERDFWITVPWNLKAGTVPQAIKLSSTETGTESITISAEEYPGAFTNEKFHFDKSMNPDVFNQIKAWSKVYVTIDVARYHDLDIKCADGVSNASLKGKFNYTGSARVCFTASKSLSMVNTKLYDQNGQAVDATLVEQTDPDTGEHYLEIPPIADSAERSLQKLTLVLSVSDQWYYNIVVNTTGEAGSYIFKCQQDIVDIGVLLPNFNTLETRALSETVTATTTVTMDGTTYDSTSGIWTYSEDAGSGEAGGNHISINVASIGLPSGSTIVINLLTAYRQMKTVCETNPDHMTGLDPNNPMTIINDKLNADIAVSFPITSEFVSQYQINWDTAATYVHLMKVGAEPKIDINMHWEINYNTNTGTIKLFDAELQKALEDRGADWNAWQLVYHVETKSR